MRKLSIFVLALFAVMAIGVVAASAAKDDKVKVGTTVTLQFNGGNGPYGEGGKFKGKVKAKKGCKKNRLVKVKKVNGGIVGEDTTDKNGNFEVPAGNDFTPGNYFAKAKKRTIEKKKKTIVCKSGRSGTIDAPGDGA